MGGVSFEVTREVQFSGRCGEFRSSVFWVECDVAVAGAVHCMAVAFLVWWCLPPSIPIDAGFRMRFSTTIRVWTVGGCCGCALALFCRHVDWCSRVDVSIQPIAC